MTGGKNPYDQKDAQKDTDATSKDVSKAWHDARDAAAKEGNWGVPEDRHGEKSDNDSKKK